MILRRRSRSCSSGKTSNASAASGTGPITSVIPTTEDGYVYIRLGKAYSTSNIDLEPVHEVKWFHNGKFCAYTGDDLPSVSASDNGKFLMVSDGKWVAQAMPQANGQSF